MSTGSTHGALVVERAHHPDDDDALRALLVEYAQSLGFSLCFQGFDEELARLPGAYAPPQGALLVAREGDTVVGLVALRPLGPQVCELKRLYVRPGARHLRTTEGLSLGRALAQAVVTHARALGYRQMRLDTVPGQMDAAIKLYRSMGFVEIPAYYPSPVPGTAFFELPL